MKGSVDPREPSCKTTYDQAVLGNRRFILKFLAAPEVRQIVDPRFWKRVFQKRDVKGRKWWKNLQNQRSLTATATSWLVYCKEQRAWRRRLG